MPSHPEHMLDNGLDSCHARREPVASAKWVCGSASGGQYNSRSTWPARRRPAAMAQTLTHLLHHLRRLTPAPGPDADLLDAFARQHDEAAFTAMVARHG